MRTADMLRLTWGALHSQLMRATLTVLGIAIGIAAVVLLTSIGKGVQRFILDEFTQFGTTIVGINPGRATTHGTAVGIFGTDKPLTLQDAAALARLPEAEAVVPFAQGNAEVEAGKRRRRTSVNGVGPDFPVAFRFEIAKGRFLPADDPESPRAFAVLGSKLAHELYGDDNPLGQRLRIGGSRFRIIGVMEPKGEFLGVDMDDGVYIPAARVLNMFNTNSLMEIDLIYNPEANVDNVVAAIKRVLTARHGREDYTVTTQQEMMDVMGSVLDVITLAVAALGGISLLVGGIGITTIMMISVRERTVEIGLLRALGALQFHIHRLFLVESIFLAGLGGLLGLLFGLGGVMLLNAFVPALPVHLSWVYAGAAELLALVIGLLAGVFPAARAARLDPVEALRAE